MTIKNFDSEADTLYKKFSEIWLLSCFSGSDWMMTTSVNVITNFF